MVVVLSFGNSATPLYSRRGYSSQSRGAACLLAFAHCRDSRVNSILRFCFGSPRAWNKDRLTLEPIYTSGSVPGLPLPCASR
jgi:hypothetical protein